MFGVSAKMRAIQQGVVAVLTGLWGWGRGNFTFNLGDGTNITKSSPIQIGLGTDWPTGLMTIANASQKIALNLGTAMIRSDNTLWTWGAGANGQLGDNTAATAQVRPNKVGTLTNWGRIVSSPLGT